MKKIFTLLACCLLCSGSLAADCPNGQCSAPAKAEVKYICTDGVYRTLTQIHVYAPTWSPYKVIEVKVVQSCPNGQCPNRVIVK